MYCAQWVRAGRVYPTPTAALDNPLLGREDWRWRIVVCSGVDRIEIVNTKLDFLPVREGEMRRGHETCTRMMNTTGRRAIATSKHPAFEIVNTKLNFLLVREGEMRRGRETRTRMMNTTGRRAIATSKHPASEIVNTKLNFLPVRKPQESPSIFCVTCSSLNNEESKAMEMELRFGWFLI